MKEIARLHVAFIAYLIHLVRMIRLRLRSAAWLAAVMLTAPFTAFAQGTAGQTPPAGQKPASPQTQPSPQAARLRVFLDCQDCFQEYLRDEIEWVDFVRQREDADIHILSSTNETGGGGREVLLRFVGVGRFQGVNHEHRALSLVADPEEVRRRYVFQAVTVGLLDYLSHAGLPADLTVSVRGVEQKGGAAAPTRDPWNFWVFNIEGGTSLNAEETSRDHEWNVRTGADRVTDAWKLSFGVEFEGQVERFDLDEERPREFRRHDRGLSLFAVKSAGPHWSFGLQGDVRSSSFDNTALSAAMAPAVEYNVFPYAEYASRQLRIQYQIGPTHAKYYEITLYNQLEELRGAHEVSVTFEQRQPWGTLDTRFEFSQYLHDASKYRLEFDGDVSVRLFRGFSVSLEGSVSRIRDQLSLPRRDATEEEVLLRLRELQSGYEIQFDISLRYSFGSLFNNIVNPRFGT
jgi:hypothetical protein